MAGEVAAVQVEGLQDLNRTFARLSKDLRKDMRAELKHVGEPVQHRAEQLAVREFSNIVPKAKSAQSRPRKGSRRLQWWRMRTGVTQTEVYVVPVQRSRYSAVNPARYARKKFAARLYHEAMVPGLEQNIPLVMRRFEHVLDEVERGFGRLS
jgi:hypothetical protein